MKARRLVTSSGLQRRMIIRHAVLLRWEMEGRALSCPTLRTALRPSLQPPVRLGLDRHCAGRFPGSQTLLRTVFTCGSRFFEVTRTGRIQDIVVHASREMSGWTAISNDWARCFTDCLQPFVAQAYSIPPCRSPFGSLNPVL